MNGRRRGRRAPRGRPSSSPRGAHRPYHRDHRRALHPASRRLRRCPPLVTGAAAATTKRPALREMADKSGLTFHLTPRCLGFCDWPPKTCLLIGGDGGTVS
uniref:Uncharacterized protein n=1 Tax=Mus musculus TaxID=10090 RepID=Q9D475_MOUSE|nr:unnamed protein product [Mus musculus]